MYFKYYVKIFFSLFIGTTEGIKQENNNEEFPDKISQNNNYNNKEKREFIYYFL